MAKPGPLAKLNAILAQASAKLPFLKRRLPGTGHAPEPFDSLEDSSSHGEDISGRNAAVGFVPEGKLGQAKVEAGEALKSFWEALLRSPVAIALLLGVLALILALLVVAVAVSLPPKNSGTIAPRVSTGRPAPAASSPMGSYSAEGAALLKTLLLPAKPSLESKVELERESGRVYTVEDAAPYRSVMDRIDIESLDARRQAAIDELYKAVP